MNDNAVVAAVMIVLALAAVNELAAGDTRLVLLGLGALALLALLLVEAVRAGRPR